MKKTIIGPSRDDDDDARRLAWND